MTLITGKFTQQQSSLQRQRLSPVSGIVHLFRSNVISRIVNETREDDQNKDLGTVVCVLAIPLWVTPQDFLKLMGSARLNVSHFTIIRDEVPNRYMLLVKFKDSFSSEEFVTEVLLNRFNNHNQFNGRPFNSFEPELCNVVHVSSVLVYDRSADPVKLNLTADLISLPFSNLIRDAEERPDLIPEHPSSSKGIIGKNPTDDINLAAAVDKMELHVANEERSHDLDLRLELPTCPVCLDRMDASVTGLLTTICLHTFHCNCNAYFI